MSLDVEALESSFALVAGRADELSQRFYERLFERNPQVQPMFGHLDMVEQRKKLIASLALIVGNLRKSDALGAYLVELGARHGEIGAVPAHYDAVGENLLAVLQEIAGDAWTPRVAQAWTDAYGAIQTTMRHGGRDRAPRAHGARRAHDPERARASRTRSVRRHLRRRRGVRRPPACPPTARA